MKPVKKIKYNQDFAKDVSNTSQGDIYNRNQTYYDVKNIVMTGKTPSDKQSSKNAALSAYLSKSGKTPAQLAKELSTTASNVKSWLRGCEIEIDYWLQLEPLLEEFLDKPQESKLYFENEFNIKEPISIDEAIFVRKYRNLLPGQKIKIHKLIDQMEIDNIDQQWDNIGVRENKEHYGALKAFSISIRVNAQESLNRLITALDKNIVIISGAPQKNKKNTFILNVHTTRSKDYLGKHIKASAGENNCTLVKISSVVR
jgi:hypothetical protein